MLSFLLPQLGDPRTKGRPQAHKGKRIKILCAIFLGGGAFLLNACSSMDVAAVQKTDKVAVSLIGVDKYIDFDNEFGAGVKIIQRLAASDKFDLEPVRQKLHKKVFNEYSEFFPFDLMNEQKVLGPDRYKKFQVYDNKDKEENFKKSAKHFLQKDGYLSYHPKSFASSQDKRKKFFQAMPSDADGMLMIALSYDLKKEESMIPGVSKGKIKANLRMILTNKKGVKIMDVRKSARSDGDMKVILNQGIPDPSKIQPLCVEATDKVMEETKTWIKEEIAESEEA